MAKKKPKGCDICGDFPVPLEEVSTPPYYPIQLCQGCACEDHDLNLFHQELVRRDKLNDFGDV